MEVSNLVFSISKMCCRFPRIRAFFIAFPFDAVLKLLMEDTGGHDLINLIFLFTFHYDWVR
jgi:hypothetical protein